MALRRFCVYLLYRLLFPVAMLCMAPRAWRKMRKRGGEPGDIWRRLGRFTPAEKAESALSSQGYWFHAVSVGEVNVALKILTQLRQLEPERPFVLSTTTTTGFLLAKQEVPVGTKVIYSPVDFLSVVRCFLDVLQPAKLVLVEAEVWPNLVAEAARRNIPVVLANARLSPRSARRYAKLRWFVEPIFAYLSQVFVQFPEDVAHWQSFGMAPEKIQLLGSVKYDDHPARPKRVDDFRGLLQSLWGPELPPLVLLASSFPGEEWGLIQALRERKLAAGVKVLLVPRHAERALDLQKELAAQGVTTELRSRLPAESQSPVDAVIVDTTGELRDWQYLPRVVVMGKSFCSTGGQNPAEAIAAGTPVITGPNMENFGPLMRQLLAADGLQQVADFAAAAAAVDEILSVSSAVVETRIGAAREALLVHQGAARRTAERLALNGTNTAGL